MCIDLFEPRNPPVLAEFWAPTSQELKHLGAIGARGRTVGNLACEIILYQHNLERCLHLFDEKAQRGLKHRLDETRLLLAMAWSSDEIDLNIKLMFLSNAEPSFPENRNLRAMALAGIQADIDRLCPNDSRFQLDRRAE